MLDDKAKPANLIRVRVSPAYGSQAALQLTTDKPHFAQRAAAVGGITAHDTASTPVMTALQRAKECNRRNSATRNRIASISRTLSFSRAVS